MDRRAGILKFDGRVLAGLLGLPDHAIEETPQWGYEPDGVELVVCGPRMPVTLPGWQFEVAIVLDGETVPEAIDRTWPQRLTTTGGNEENETSSICDSQG